MSGLALLDKSGWAPLGAGDDQTHPILIALVGLALVVAVPFAWGLIRRTEGLPMFGTPTVQELETPYGSNTPAVDREPSPPAQEPAEPTP
jgi:hypothetical protein